MGIDRAERWNDLYPTPFLHTCTQRERMETVVCVCVCVRACVRVCCVLCKGAHVCAFSV